MGYSGSQEGGQGEIGNTVFDAKLFPCSRTAPSFSPVLFCTPRTLSPVVSEILSNI